MPKNDGFNRLVLRRGCHGAMCLCCVLCALPEADPLGFEYPYANTLVGHADIARELVAALQTRFYLARKLSAADSGRYAAAAWIRPLSGWTGVAGIERGPHLRRYPGR